MAPLPGEDMADNSDLHIRYLDRPLASAHGADWFRRRFLVYVPFQSGTDPAQDENNNLLTALHSVVNVVEAPFLPEYSQRYTMQTDFVFVNSIAQSFGVNQVDKFYKAQKDLGEIGGGLRHFTVNADDSVQILQGLYFGMLVHAPSGPNGLEPPRGRVYVRLRPKDTDNPLPNRGGEEQAICEVTFGRGGPPAGIYAGQDRFIFQCALHGDADLPMALSPPKTGHLLGYSATFLKYKAIAFLPPGDANDRPAALLFSLAPPKRLDLNVPDTFIQPLIEDGMEALTLNASDDDSKMEAALRGVLPVNLENNYSADLVIEPDINFARLRHDPCAINQSCFEVLGVLMPAPVEENDVLELNLFFTRSGHLVAHSLEASQKAIKIKPRMRASWTPLDQAQIVDANGNWDQIKLNKQAGAEAVGDAHQFAFLSWKTRLPWELANTAPHGGKGGIMALQNSGRALYCLSRKGAAHDAGPVLGYFACPVLPNLAPGDDRIAHPVMAQEGQPGSKPAQLKYSRSGEIDRADVADPTLGLCIDWLDESIKVVPRRKNAAIQGLAAYWSSHIADLAEYGIGRQSLCMAEYDDSSYKLVLREEFGAEETETELKQGTVVRLGPLICRYICKPPPPKSEG